LPGRSPERIVFETNADGVNWVQENGTVAMLALARYFASLPIACGPRTYEFAFTSGHLHLSMNGTDRYAEQLDHAYDGGTVAFEFTLEHLGVRELAAEPRSDGPGRRLAFSGKGELTALSIMETPVMVAAATVATIRRGLERTAIIRGTGLPGATIPPHCAPGGEATQFWRRLIPSMQLISGPWSLWAPVFGEQAVDFDRMRAQTLMAGDIALAALDDVPRQLIAGPVPVYRTLRALGAPGCPPEHRPEQAPRPGATPGLPGHPRRPP